MFRDLKIQHEQTETNLPILFMYLSCFTAWAVLKLINYVSNNRILSITLLSQAILRRIIMIINF